MELVETIMSDRAAGARQLVAEYGNRMYNAAIYLCGRESDAEDYVFRTFEKVIARISQFKGRASLFTWMYGIMLNLIRTDLRRKGANALDFPEELPEVPAPGPDAGAALDAGIEAAAVRAAVRELPFSLRSVVVLRYYEDLSVPEIAQALALPEGTVKRRLYDARNAIRERISRTIRPEASSNP